MLRNVQSDPTDIPGNKFESICYYLATEYTRKSLNQITILDISCRKSVTTTKHVVVTTTRDVTKSALASRSFAPVIKPRDCRDHELAGTTWERRSHTLSYHLSISPTRSGDTGTSTFVRRRFQFAFRHCWGAELRHLFLHAGAKSPYRELDNVPIIS